jgi:benzodiazapine receptor
MQYFKFLLCSVFCVGGGFLSGLFTNSGLQTWYPGLVKSSLNPPGFVFPIAWTILYLLMGVSLYLIWTLPSIPKQPWYKKSKKGAIALFGLQIFFNFIWSFLFFYLENPGLALLDIVCLWFSLVAMMIVFFRMSKVACFLQIPYLMWISFALYLNFFIWIHN